MIQRDDHIETGLALLITQYKGKTNLEGSLQVWLTQVQGLEDVFFQILSIIEDLDSQVGEQLDLIGRLVGQARDGRTDEVYLKWLKAKILINKASGLPDELLRVLSLVATNDRTYAEAYAASFLINVLGVLDNAQEIAALLGLVRGAGINGQMIYSEDSDATTFTFASGDVEESSSDLGWANDGQTTGGYFADVEEL